MIRSLAVVAVLVLAGCPGNPSHPANPPGGGARTGHGTSSSGHTRKSHEKPAKSAKPDYHGVLPEAGIDCAPTGCIYHGGADAYYTCLAAGAGTCFHYGPTCEPASHCMYSAAAGGYHQCSKVVEGQCVTAGAPCEPPGNCYYDPADGRHHRCKRADGGRCLELGGLCDPAPAG